jgi:hypothetical protein
MIRCSRLHYVIPSTLNPFCLLLFSDIETKHCTLFYNIIISKGCYSYFTSLYYYSEISGCLLLLLLIVCDMWYYFMNFSLEEILHCRLVADQSNKCKISRSLMLIILHPQNLRNHLLKTDSILCLPEGLGTRIQFCSDIYIYVCQSAENSSRHE